MIAMATRVVRAAPQLARPDFSRLASLVAAVLDVFAEAQAQARAAHERYPFKA